MRRLLAMAVCAVIALVFATSMTVFQRTGGSCRFERVSVSQASHFASYLPMRPKPPRPVA